jgi:hypothetical protein
MLSRRVILPAKAGQSCENASAHVKSELCAKPLVFSALFTKPKFVSCCAASCAKSHKGRVVIVPHESDRSMHKMMFTIIVELYGRLVDSVRTHTHTHSLVTTHLTRGTPPYSCTHSHANQCHGIEVLNPIHVFNPCHISHTR